MPLGTTREKTLFGLGKARGNVHRYTYVRWAVGIAFTALIAWLPLSGTLRFDLWSGRHMWLGERASLVEVAKAFAFPFLAVNVAIVLVSRFLGRYLCGFVCPYGALARLAEWFRWRGRKRRVKVAKLAALGAVSALLAAITFSFWIDWRVFVEGSTAAAVVSGGLLFGLAALVFLTVELLGLRFCHDWCPSGVYFAVLGHDTLNGIEFAHPESCTDCKACEHVCPMDLHPTHMAAAEGDEPLAGSGLYPDGLTAHATCIRCGDCVVACEGTTARSGEPTPLRMGFLPRETGGEDGEREHAEPRRERAAS